MPERAVLHEAIREAADPVGVLDRIVRQSLVLVPAADGASLELRRDAETLEYLCVAGTLSSFVGLHMPINSSLSGLAVRTGEVQRCDDATDDPRVNAAAVTATGIRSMLCVPLSQRHGGVAVLKVSSQRPGAFTGEDARRLTNLAGFLDSIVSAASQLAAATADVLTRLDRDGDGDATADAARFVANVMTPGLVDRVEGRMLIRDILAGERISIALQPIVELGSGTVTCVEALARFQAGQHPPDWWFDLAHQVGLGNDLELLALRKALATSDVVPDGARIAVNVSPRTVVDPRLPRALAAVPLQRVTIEMTEHDEVSDYDAVAAALGPLRAAGAWLSVDDTGSGYSGLAHILRLSPDVIKLDRELVVGIQDDPVKRALATSLVTFARSLDAVVVAEGIEQAREADCLRDLGVHYGQGHFFGRPLLQGDAPVSGGAVSGPATGR